jgi:hypothetical protein
MSFLSMFMVVLLEHCEPQRFFQSTLMYDIFVIVTLHLWCMKHAFMDICVYIDDVRVALAFC